MLCNRQFVNTRSPISWHNVTCLQHQSRDGPKMTNNWTLSFQFTVYLSENSPWLQSNTDASLTLSPSPHYPTAFQHRRRIAFISRNFLRYIHRPEYSSVPPEITKFYSALSATASQPSTTATIAGATVNATTLSSSL